jgi:hypothetical protein
MPKMLGLHAPAPRLKVGSGAPAVAVWAIAKQGSVYQWAREVGAGRTSVGGVQTPAEVSIFGRKP